MSDTQTPAENKYIREPDPVYTHNPYKAAGDKFTGFKLQDPVIYPERLAAPTPTKKPRK